MDRVQLFKFLSTKIVKQYEEFVPKFKLVALVAQKSLPSFLHFVLKQCFKLQSKKGRFSGIHFKNIYVKNHPFDDFR